MALKSFKKMLNISWMINDVSSETEAYDLISIQYFYLGNMLKSQYYHDRSVRGKCEAKTSNIRQIFVRNEKSRISQKNELADLSIDTTLKFIFDENNKLSLEKEIESIQRMKQAIVRVKDESKLTGEKKEIIYEKKNINSDSDSDEKEKKRAIEDDDYT
jgi:hypothetical protein